MHGSGDYQLGAGCRLLHPRLLVLIAMVAAACGLGGHSESWHYGYKHVDDAAKYVSQGWSIESACRSVAGIGEEYGGLDHDDVYHGCLVGVRDAGVDDGD